MTSTRVSGFAGGLLHYVLAAAMVIVTALLLSALRDVLDTPAMALLFLVPVGLSTALWGLGQGITAALFAFLGFNYFFLKPLYTFTVHRPEDVVVLIVFLVVAAVISQLVARAQAGMAAARARESETTKLYELSTALAGRHDEREIVQALTEHVASTFGAEAVEVQAAPSAGDIRRLPAAGSIPLRPADAVVPIEALQGPLGEIRLWQGPGGFSPAQRRLLRAFASQGALALERAALQRAEGRARLLEESDRFKSSLLSSVSHELRSPLATIKAAASSLRGGEVRWDSAARPELLAAIDEEADHLNTLVGNLLDMSRIESGALRPEREWNVLSEIVESVLTRMRRQLEHHTIQTAIPEDLPLVPVDYIQMQQVFTNLLSNSAKYAPAGTRIRIEAQAHERTEVLVQVSNQGPPVPPEHLDRIFDKFYRITAADRVTGTGLGLSICKGIVEAHGGRIWAANLPDGFSFNFTLPLTMDGADAKRSPAEPEGT